MKRRFLSSAAVPLGAASVASPSAAQVLEPPCVVEPAVVYPPGVAERMVPTGRPAIELECESGEGLFDLAPTLPVPLPVALPIAPVTDPMGGDLTVEFVS
jgi:hypothetical protein